MTKALLACGVVGPALFVVVFLIEGALRADYDPMRHQVSLLSLSADGLSQILSFFICGAMIVAFAVGIRSVLVPGRASLGGPVAVACVGAGLILAGLFSVQPSFGYPPGAPAGIGSEVSASSYFHVAGAMFFMFGMAAACLLFVARFRRAGRPGWALYSLTSGIVILAFFAASSGGPDGQPLFPAYAGFFQRVAIVVGLGWLVVLAAGMLGGRIESSSSAASPGTD